MSARNRNELWARALLDELARAGVRHLVVAPGSRSTPVVLAAAADRRFRTAVQVDERSAAFLALGVGKGTGIPAAVVTTSGTAVANLLPAVVEAAQSEVPLLVLSADRPPRLRGADANQAIEQPGIFGRYLRFEAELSPAELSDRTLRHLREVANRAVAAAVGAPAGPVHLNLPFEKPFEPVSVPGDLPPGLEESAPLAMAGRRGGEPFTRIHPRILVPDDAVLADLARRLREARRPLLVAGPHPLPEEAGPPVAALAHLLGAPLLADPLSGARGRSGLPESGAAPLPGIGYDLALRIPEVRKRLVPDLVVRFGTTPSSASLAGWLDELRGVPQVVVDGGGRWKDHLAVASEVIPGDVARVAQGLAARVGAPVLEARTGEAGPDEGWPSAWARVDGAVAEAAEAALSRGLPEGAAAVEAARDAGAHADVLFVSNSMPVRDVDALWPVASGADPREATGVRTLGNRGASGIDGIVSTALGVGWGTGARVTVLLGDLALVHDMNGLLRAGKAPGGDPSGAEHDGRDAGLSFRPRSGAR
jgi:2-succinyl-5-enolpyruvyl-6-hydroxy-3-cyclohexene-1-carboxylate synthase